MAKVAKFESSCNGFIPTPKMAKHRYFGSKNCIFSKYLPSSKGETRSVPATLHRLQNPKWPSGAPKLPTGPGKVPTHRFLGAPANFCHEIFIFVHKNKLYLFKNLFSNKILHTLDFHMNQSTEQL